MHEIHDTISFNNPDFYHPCYFRGNIIYDRYDIESVQLPKGTIELHSYARITKYSH